MNDVNAEASVMGAKFLIVVAIGIGGFFWGDVVQGETFRNPSEDQTVVIALEVLDALEKLRPDDASIYERRAYLLYNHNIGGVYTDAIVENLDRAGQLTPKFQYATTYMLRGRVNMSRLHDKQALADFGEAIKMTPDDTAILMAYIERGTLLGEQGDYTAALQDASKAVELVPSSKRAHFLLGITYFSLDEIALAESAFLKAYELDSKWTLESLGLLEECEEIRDFIKQQKGRLKHHDAANGNSAKENEVNPQIEKKRHE